MYLGVEIGGTKLQLGVGSGTAAEFADLVRLTVDPRKGAAGIREQMGPVGRELVQRFGIRYAAIGFGGPVDAARGTTTKSHQIDGWENFPLADWCRQTWGIPTQLGNDCDVATLAEAKYGAGAGQSIVFYVTVGTGVGGGCVMNGQLLGQGRPAVAEIGHLRPGLSAVDPHATVESLASGWGIANNARKLLQDAEQKRFTPAEIQTLMDVCRGDLEQLTAAEIAAAARRGNPIATEALDNGLRALGWGIAQVVTLIAPNVVVVGGGVSLIGEQFFFAPLRAYVDQYVFPPLRNAFTIVPSGLGEQVVVHGAVALANLSAKS